MIYNYSPKWTWIYLHYSPTLQVNYCFSIYFLLLFGTAAALPRLIEVFCPQLLNQNATPFCFGSEVNSAMLFRDTQPIKLQKKHYSDFEFKLRKVIYRYHKQFWATVCAHRVVKLLMYTVYYLERNWEWGGERLIWPTLRCLFNFYLETN